MTRLDLARAGHCRSGLWSPRLGLTRLGSARLATRGSTHLRSWLRLSLGLRIWTGESTRCSTRLNSEFGSGSARSLARAQLGVWLRLSSEFGSGSARSLARTQLGVRSEIGSGIATPDLVWLGSEESELSSSYLDRSIARPIWSRLISVRNSYKGNTTQNSSSDVSLPMCAYIPECGSIKGYQIVRKIC